MRACMSFCIIYGDGASQYHWKLDCTLWRVAVIELKDDD